MSAETMRRTNERSMSTGPAPRRISRTPEKWIAGIGLGLATVLQGGFTYVMNRVEPEAFAEALGPAMESSGLGTADGYEAASTLAAWFGFSLVLVLGLSALGFFFATRRPNRKSTGGWFLAAGLVCLLGTQLVLYPVAFFFFLAAAFFAVRSTQ